MLDALTLKTPLALLLLDKMLSLKDLFHLGHRQPPAVNGTLGRIGKTSANDTARIKPPPEQP
jgi:hypothetical protein